jgi:hypothetical protein
MSLGTIGRHYRTVKNFTKRTQDPRSKRGNKPFTGNGQVESDVGNNLRAQGKDNPFTLNVRYNYKLESSDGSGIYVGASGAYFDPTGLPGWASLKLLFKEFRLVFYAINIKPVMGDNTGLLSFRKTNEAGAVVFGTIEAEIEYGADDIPIAELHQGKEILNLPDTPEEAKWHIIDAVTDSNNFGFAKEFGQIFIRGRHLPVSTGIFTFTEHCRVVFRGYKS